MSHPAYLWLNGEVVPWESATIHIVDARELSSVSSVFEGVRAYWNAEREQLYIFRLQDHLRRLLGSMKVLRMASPFSVEALAQATVTLVRQNEQREDLYIRPVATVAPAPRALGTPADTRNIEMLISAAPSPSSLGEDRQRHVGVSSWNRISDNSLPPRIKSNANYLASTLVSMQARADGYDSAIILNTDGKVSEGPWACVFLVRDGRLITSTVTSNILESITRLTVIQLARDGLGLTVEERAVDRTELYLADEVFFCGTGVELTPIVSVDRYPVGDGTVGPLTARLRALYHAVVRGQESAYQDWLTPVY